MENNNRDDLVTFEEFQEILQIGRTTAYQLLNSHWTFLENTTHRHNGICFEKKHLAPVPIDQMTAQTRSDGILPARRQTFCHRQVSAYTVTKKERKTTDIRLNLSLFS